MAENRRTRTHKQGTTQPHKRGCVNIDRISFHDITKIETNDQLLRQTGSYCKEIIITNADGGKFEINLFGSTLDDLHIEEVE